MRNVDVEWLPPHPEPHPSRQSEERGGAHENACLHTSTIRLEGSLNLHERKMAERAPTGGIKIASRGETTPEYNAVRKSYGEINLAIIPDDFVSEAHICGLIPTRNLSRPRPLDVVLDEISGDPVCYYSLQHVVATLNVGSRFNNSIDKMENAFQCKNNKR